MSRRSVLTVAGTFVVLLAALVGVRVLAARAGYELGPDEYDDEESEIDE